MNYDIRENEKIKDIVTYDELINDVNILFTEKKENEKTDNFKAQELDYTLNYTVKELKRITKYYEINIKKKKKEEVINMIMLFENNEKNEYVVERRKTLWFYLQEIQEDPFLSRYVVLS